MKLHVEDAKGGNADILEAEVVLAVMLLLVGLEDLQQMVSVDKDLLVQEAEVVVELGEVLMLVQEAEEE